MTRDMDLIREILLDFEQNEDLDGSTAIAGWEFGGYSKNAVEYHLALMAESGLIHTAPVNGAETSVLRLTSFGHDFLDSIRDPAIWQKTKDVAQNIGGLSLSLMADLANGLVKEQLKSRIEIQAAL
ncbi:DUF2513 domain-containing protein [Fulvimarina sp. MAC8]|uniref:DUF2513 domain-containing protein n=1 Tax=Fulvimarina sp. MAC8 TaxID=3162874 RepID=UPI0032ECB759